MRVAVSAFLVVSWAVLTTEMLHAQLPVTLGSEQEDYYRFLELDGRLGNAPLVFRSPSRLRTVTTPAGPWSQAGDSARRRRFLHAIPPLGRLMFNSRYPRGTNDGALWAGRGVSWDVTAGTQLQLGLVTATLAPTLWYADNRGFDTVGVSRPGRSPFVYPWATGIDWPQRFGPREVMALDWGQSGVRLDAGGFTAGVSTENQWWGPAFLHPLLMSNTAAGFPHVDLGVGRPVSIGVGRVEARIMWGRLAESDHFDTVTTNNGRLFTGLVIGFQPKWIPGLTLGAARLFYTTWNDSLRLVDFTDVFLPVFKRQLVTPTSPQGNDARDQLLSLSLRWLLPESGFETYLEWGWNDHRADFRDFLLEPDHAQGWVFGFQKAFPSGNGAMRLRAEATLLGRARTFLVREEPTFYVHHLVLQGYTHRGQLVGAGIGPGSDAQHVGVDRFHRTGRWGVYVQRVRYNDDAYYIAFAPTRARLGHNVEMTVGVSIARFIGNWENTLNVTINRELNRHYVVKNDVTNFSLGLAVRPPGSR